MATGSEAALGGDVEAGAVAGTREVPASGTGAIAGRIAEQEDNNTNQTHKDNAATQSRQFNTFKCDVMVHADTTDCNNLLRG